MFEEPVVFVNFTPHPINIWPDGTRASEIILVSEGSARVQMTPGVIELFGDIPVAQPSRLGSVEGLPEPQEGVFIVVSTIVAVALKGQRNDLLVPATADSAIRDEQGHIVAVRHLARV